jgi:phosphatidylserine/phosphatidylglycerophosphate/cardiolipin synthase-like enzyme
MSRSLIVLPDDSAQPILKAIEDARNSLRIKMFIFSDPALMAAVKGARRRGVHVRVMLNPARRDGRTENDDSRVALADAGVEVIASNPAFDLTHEKSMVVDDAVALVQSFNWETANLTDARDYGIFTSHKHEVDEIAGCFDADWDRSNFKTGDHSHLIWCIGNGRQRMGRFIDDAKHTLWLQHERFQDPTIIEHLVRAHCRGVKVHILSRPIHKLKKEKLMEGVSGLRVLQDIGIKIHKMKHVHLHAKLLFADNARAIIGSINLAPGSFDSRRELAIAVDDEHVIQRIHTTLHHDWEQSSPLDLSDDALLADLKQYGSEVVENLAIDDSEGRD